MVLGNDKVSKKPPPLLPKPTGLGSRKGKAFINECEASTSSSTLSPSQVSNPLEKLVDHILKRRTEISTIREKIVEAERFNTVKTNDLANLRKANEERDMDRILELIQDPETSLTKLTKIVSEADERRSALEQKFILARDAKLSELNKLLPHDASNDKPYCDGIATTLQNKIDNMEEELSAKLRIKSKLQKELAKRKILEENEITDEAVQPKIKRSNPRRKYLRRILEICANINSQNAEITKMVKSVNTLNHEIGNLSGNLDRTWIAVDKWLSKLAEQDPRMQQAYKQLLRIHGHCAAVREAITEVGQLSRNIDELTDKNELQDQQTNSIDDQFQKLLDDLLQVKDENTRLTRQLEKSN